MPSKPCTLCSTPRDVLVRCQIDASQTWHFVCPGACWKSVSGGVIDGDENAGHEWYRYGGMWKNKHEAVSAKKPKKKKKGEGDGEMREWKGGGVRYTKNDVVRFQGGTWVCRRGHVSEEGVEPGENVSLWKEGVVEEGSGGEGMDGSLG